MPIRRRRNITSGSGDILLKQTVTLTHDQIKLLPTTPVEILAAPGVDKVYTIMSAIVLFHDAVDYTNVDAAATLRLDFTTNRTGASTRLEVGNENFFDWGAPDDVIGNLGVPNLFYNAATVTEIHTAPNQLAIIKNSPVDVAVANGALGNFTGGNAANTLKVTVWYDILTL